MNELKQTAKVFLGPAYILMTGVAAGILFLGIGYCSHNWPSQCYGSIEKVVSRASPKINCATGAVPRIEEKNGSRFMICECKTDKNKSEEVK